MSERTPAPPHGVIVEIGRVPVRFVTSDPACLKVIADRYSDFTTVTPSSLPFDLSLEIANGRVSTSDDVRVTFTDGRWRFERGDFLAEWIPSEGRGQVRHMTANPYSLDSALRILHTIVLAPQRGFLLHASSAVRNGRAFVFSGVSGAGKTTISRLAPPDVTLLTDEISYIRPDGAGYQAFGTPFAGELAKPGENVVAPLETLFFLAQGPANKIDPISKADATRMLMRNILFFAEDPDLVRQVFEAACQFVARVPVYRLTFLPDPSVWEIIS